MYKARETDQASDNDENTLASSAQEHTHSLHDFVNQETVEDLIFSHLNNVPSIDEK